MKNTSGTQVSQMLAKAAINLKLASTNRDEVLSELVNQVPELVDLPDRRETLLRALREREQLHSTCIGDGIALPHARNALVGLVDQTILVFGRHDTGVPFGGLDDLPAKVFFLIIAPSVTQHLAVLAKLSRLLREPRLRHNLLTADSPDKVISALKDAEAQAG